MTTDDLTAVDSEIALTALLAGIVTSVRHPANGRYPVIQGLALGLLVLTLARRMAIMEGFSSRSAFLRGTTQVMDPATTICTLYLSFLFNKWLGTTVASEFSLPLVVGITTPVLVIGILLIWELVYQSALKEGERVFEVHAERHEGEFLGRILTVIADFVETRRLGADRRFHQTSLIQYGLEFPTKDESGSTDERVLGNDVLVFVLVMSGVLLSYCVVIWYSGTLFGGWWVTRVMLFLSTLVVNGSVKLWYSKYGIVKVEGRNGVVSFLGEVIAFLLFASVLLG